MHNTDSTMQNKIVCSKSSHTSAQFSGLTVSQQRSIGCESIQYQLVTECKSLGTLINISPWLSSVLYSLYVRYSLDKSSFLTAELYDCRALISEVLKIAFQHNYVLQTKRQSHREFLP